MLSGIPSLVRSSHNTGRLRVSNAAQRSTNAAKVGWPKSCLRCAILHKVAMRSHVEWPGVNPLCWWCLCWFDSCKEDMCKQNHWIDFNKIWSAELDTRHVNFDFVPAMWVVWANGLFATVFRSTSKSRPNNIRGKKCLPVRPSVRPSVHKKFLQFEWKLVYR